MMAGEYRYIAQEKVIFGRPAAEAVVQQATVRGARRVFVVSTKSLSRKTPVVESIMKALGERCAGLFDECIEHTPRESVIALVSRLRETGADLVVTIGGGTPIDTVKVALLCLEVGATSTKDLDNWHVRVKADGSREIPAVPMGKVRQIAIPTTLSGAEFSDLGGCTDVAQGIKQGFTAPGVCPVVVVLDPAFTAFTPERLWLSTGVRSVDHAVEAICSINAQPMTDALCLEALRKLGGALKRTRDDQNDLAARLDCQLAVWLASSSINRTEYGASHGMGHVLGGAYGTPHGVTSCVLLPGVLAFNRSATQPQQTRIAEAIGARDASEGVRALIASLGLPTRLSEILPDKSRFLELAKKSLANQWVRTNPVRIDSEEQALKLLETCW
ncbi:MAG: iron-containing alcohol dehydrogenase [Beijerinckiaceae bacterium]